MATRGGDYGDIHRYEPARESTAAAIAIVLLTIVEVVFVGLFTYGLLSGWGFTPYGNMYLGGILSIIFVDLAFVLMLYRKEFLPDVMIVKKRRRKYEDIYTREEDQYGTRLGGEVGPWDQFKRAVYPYYKR